MYRIHPNHSMLHKIRITWTHKYISTETRTHNLNKQKNLNFHTLNSMDQIFFQFEYALMSRCPSGFIKTNKLENEKCMSINGNQIETWQAIYILKVGLGISRTNADSQLNPVYNAFHRIFCCANETIRR